MGKIRHPGEDLFFEAVMSLKSQEDCRVFFEDICTIKELQAMAQRLEVARQLTAGRNYNAVSADTGASTATISRINNNDTGFLLKNHQGVFIIISLFSYLLFLLPLLRAFVFYMHYFSNPVQ